MLVYSSLRCFVSSEVSVQIFFSFVGSVDLQYTVVNSLFSSLFMYTVVSEKSVLQVFNLAIKSCSSLLLLFHNKNRSIYLPIYKYINSTAQWRDILNFVIFRFFTNLLRTCKKSIKNCKIVGIVPEEMTSV